MPAPEKVLSMRMRFLVSGLVCLLMSSVLFAAAFPSGVRLTRLDHGQPGQAEAAVVRAAESRPRS